MIPLSILELARVTPEGGVRAALDNARAVALRAEEAGYERVWVAEHHNFPGIASAATSLVISHIAAGSSRIRVGAGGIMLPNHSPLVIAEQFGTLAHLYPGRIDLGLGRAPGTDMVTVRALRRSAHSAERFPHDVLEIQAFLGPEVPGQPVVATPGVGTEVPLWILGSSTFGAALAAQLGLPYAFASHFAPQQLHRALEVYRTRFQPSKQLESPRVMVGVNAIAAESDEEARRLGTTQLMSFTDLLRNARGLIKPPIESMDGYWTALEKHRVMEMLALSVYGSPATVKARLEEIVHDTQADELILVSEPYGHEERVRSVEMIAEAWRG